MTFSRNSSLFFQRCTKAAVRAATTAMIAQPTGPMPAMAVASFPPAPTPSFASFTKVRMPLPRDEIACKPFPTPVVSLPTTRSTGPMAAAKAAMRMMVFLVPSSIFWSFSTKAWMCETMFRMVGISASPIWIISSCRADLRMVICPARLSCMVSAMLCAEPSQLSMAEVSFSKSSGEALMTASQPAMEFLPKIADAAAACSASESPPIFARRSIMVSRRLMDPSSFSTRAMLYLSM